MPCINQCYVQYNPHTLSDKGVTHIPSQVPCCFLLRSYLRSFLAQMLFLFQSWLGYLRWLKITCHIPAACLKSGELHFHLSMCQKLNYIYKVNIFYLYFMNSIFGSRVTNHCGLAMTVQVLALKSCVLVNLSVLSKSGLWTTLFGLKIFPGFLY